MANMCARNTAADSGQHALVRPVTILIPAYGASDKLHICLASLAAHATPGCTIFVLDDGTPNNTVQAACRDVQKHFTAFYYIRREQNGGFVSTCNWGYHDFWDGTSDLLLLNSDTEVTPGYLSEMQQVLHAHERHAVVTPRSNNATIFSVPASGERLPAQSSFELWSRIRHLLPRYNVMPTAVGFCMLIKSEVLRRFDLFDEAYSPGYNEENDFVCRINRFGYSAVAANWAYVFHNELSSFGARREQLEVTNRLTLLSRYPEYSRKVDDYLRFDVHPIEHFACLYKPHRPRILFDLFHLPLAYNGTSEYGLNLLREVSCVLESEFDLYVGVSYEALTHFSPELQGYKFYMDAPGASEIFDLVFKPAQIFAWGDYKRAIRLAPRIAYTLQDIIAVRCEYLNTPHQQTIFRKAAELSDQVFTISRASHSDFEAFYGMTLPMRLIYHGSDFGMAAGDIEATEYILIMGNHYCHKGVEEAIEQLAGSCPVVVLGGQCSEPASTPSNVRRLRSGHLPRQYLRQLFVKAQMVVYPSHYEGCGLPVLDALALGKPVIALDTEANREILEFTQSPNLCMIGSASELGPQVRRLLAQGASPVSFPVRNWRAAGEEYAGALRQMLSQEIDLSKLRARWDLSRCLDCLVA